MAANQDGDTAPVTRGRLIAVLRRWRPSAITIGAPVLPLGVLFGLNAVDELDRTAFAVLLPDIRDHFGLSDAAALGLVAATTITIVLDELPLAFYTDRCNRVLIATADAAMWSLFSAATRLGGVGRDAGRGPGPALAAGKRWSHPRSGGRAHAFDAPG